MLTLKTLIFSVSDVSEPITSWCRPRHDDSSFWKSAWCRILSTCRDSTSSIAAMRALIVRTTFLSTTVPGISADAQRAGRLGNAAGLDDGEQHAQLGGREVEGLGKRPRQRPWLQRGLLHHERCNGAPVLHASALGGGKRKHVRHIALAVAVGQHHGDAAAAEGHIAALLRQ